MTRYIDARDPNISTEDALALYHGIAKPYPDSYYYPADELLEYKAEIAMEYVEYAWDAAKSDVRFHNARTKNGAPVASYRNVRSRWAEYSSPLNAWENLNCPL